MLYWFVEHYRQALDAAGLSALRVLTFPTFQALGSILLSFALVLAAGGRTIEWLRRRKVGDVATFDQAEMDALMAGKKGTPTMGGVLIVGSITLTTLLLADLSNFYVTLGLLCVVLFGALGMADDWLKLTEAARFAKLAAEAEAGGSATGRSPVKATRDGLRSGEKLLFQLLIAFILTGFAWTYGRAVPEAMTLYVPFSKTLAVVLPVWLFLAIGTGVITGSSNGVNLTDGLDGLVAGIMAIVGTAFVVLAIVVGDYALSSHLLYHHFPAAGQMGVFAGAVVGASLGFLWFNAYPARVFMGDTGSLALGGLIGYVAVVLRQELLLAIVGGVFVVETLSVMVQRYWFKYTRLRYGEGRRVFRMAPIHHHFQRCGWPETQVVARFWIVTAVLAVTALATLKLR